MAYGKSNGHVTDYVTRLWNVELLTPSPIRLKPNSSKTAGNAIINIANY